MSRDITAAVKQLATEAGFARVGIAPAGAVAGAEAYEAWLARGLNASMAYMAENREKRLCPAKLVPGARSVICLAAAYDPDNEPAASESQSHRTMPFVARYARGQDYHKLLKRQCRELMDRIRRIAPDFQGRAFVDSAPVLERQLAAAAGVGWIGRNAMLIAPGLGSYCFLCEIICNLPLRPDSPVGSECDNCGACVAACPTGAIGDDGLIDASRCISYLTIEHRGRIDRDLWPLLGVRIFGCDACQEVCPHNRRSTAVPAVAPQARGLCYTLADILSWSRDDWDAATRGSAVRRATYEMLLRNSAIAAGNSADASLAEPLAALRNRAPGLREEIDWAAERLVHV